MGDVVVCKLDKITNHVRGGLEAIICETVPKTCQRAGEQNDHEIPEIWTTD